MSLWLCVFLVKFFLIEWLIVSGKKIPSIFLHPFLFILYPNNFFILNIVNPISLMYISPSFPLSLFQLVPTSIIIIIIIILIILIIYLCLSFLFTGFRSDCLIVIYQLGLSE